MSMPLGRAKRWKAGVGLLLVATALGGLAAACGGGGGGEPQSASGGREAYIVQAISGPPVVGESRFAFAILDRDNLLVDADNVRVRIFTIDQQTAVGQLAGEVAPTERRIEGFLPHLHPDGVVHPHSETTVFYTVDKFNFARSGFWGFEVTALVAGGQQIRLQTDPFEVAAQPAWPTVGKAVPATHNKTVREVADIAEIDSSSPPRPFMHQVAIDEALAQKRPFVVTFSTPAFCRSATCGPVTEIVASFYDKYKERLLFIHVEPYDMEALRKERKYEISALVQQWGIPSEPWTFVVGADGVVVADLGGLFAPEELEAAIQKALGARAGG